MNQPFKSPQEFLLAAANGKYIKDLRTQEVLKLDRDGYFTRTDGSQVTIHFFDFDKYALHVEPPKPREFEIYVSKNGVPRITWDSHSYGIAEGESIKVREVLP